MPVHHRLTAPVAGADPATAPAAVAVVPEVPVPAPGALATVEAVPLLELVAVPATNPTAVPPGPAAVVPAYEVTTNDLDTTVTLVAAVVLALLALGGAVVIGVGGVGVILVVADHLDLSLVCRLTDRLGY